MTLLLKSTLFLYGQGLLGIPAGWPPVLRRATWGAHSRTGGHPALSLQGNTICR